MSRKIDTERDSEHVTIDGTAARTRPLSIKDIMLQREKKAASEAKKTKEGPQENYKGPSDYMEQGRGSKSRKEPGDMPLEGSKKEKSRETTREGSKKEFPRHEPREDPKKDDMRYTPKEVSNKDNFKNRPKDFSKISDMKGIPKVLEKEDHRDAPKKGPIKDSSSMRSDDHIVVRHKGVSTSHNRTSISGLADDSRDANIGLMRARNGDATKSQKGPGKSWNDETVADSRIKDRSEKLQNTTKRKGRSFDDEKNSEADRPVLKRHDSARFQDSKHPEKNDGRKDYAKSYHREPKLRRRRSRSRDLDREKHSRSISPSPREQRRSHREPDFGNYPPYFSMEKARRKHTETDKERTSRNGACTSGSYRRHESQLGGYSPRRKKTASQAEQATTKTPSQVTQSPEKKSATWDQPPVRIDESNFHTTLHPAIGQMAPSVLAKISALKKDATAEVETILAGNNLSADSVQLTQATRPLRRLHIENLPDSATEDMLIDCLNDFLLSSRLKDAQRSKPCLSCTLNKEKHQAFVEFLTPEDATTALSFDGRPLDGSALKIRRPKEYIETTHGAPTKSAEEVTISDTVADSPHKIFVAGISGAISSEMLMEIVSAFGRLAAYCFLFNEELAEPCAFLEYMDPSITPKACAGLNGMKLGGRVLTAVHVFTSPAEVDNGATPFYGIPDNAKSLLEEPTKVLELKDVFDQEEYMLLPKSELEETLEDVRIECARFGAVKSVNVVEHLYGSDNTAEGNILQPEKESIKIEPTEHRDHDNVTEAASELSVPNQGTDVPGENPAGKDVDSFLKSLGQKDLPSNAVLCEGHAPAADLDGIQEKAALPTLQRVEANHKVSEGSTDEDKLMEEAEVADPVDDDAAVEKGLVDSIGSETRTLGDESEKSGRDNKQLGADCASEDHMEKVPAVQAVLEPGSILVEFTREEAACMAAHSLHGRRFGNRTVSIRYVPHDLYLQKYPK